jgi:AcrR family transcriptional regulator
LSYRRSDLMEERMTRNRERIVHAARTLVSVGGFREAQVAAVAAEAGVSTGLIYRYFPSKTELFVEVLTVAIDAEIVILRGAAAAHTDARDQLGAAIEAFVRRALAGPALAYAFIAEPVDPEVDAERIRGIVGAFTEALVGPVAPILKEKTSGPAQLVESIREVCLRAAGSAK